MPGRLFQTPKIGRTTSTLRSVPVLPKGDSSGFPGFGVGCLRDDAVGTAILLPVEGPRPPTSRRELDRLRHRQVGAVLFVGPLDYSVGISTTR